MRFKNLALGVFLVLGIFIWAIPFALGADKPIKIIIGHVGMIDILGDDHGISKVFKDCVESHSGGNMVVEIFPQGQLGQGRELIEQVQRGTIQMTTGGDGETSIFAPDLVDTLVVPYLFSGPEVAYKVFDGWYGEELKNEMQKKTGLRVLGISENGIRQWTNNVRPITKLEDFKGLKIRTIQSEAQIKLVSLLGGSATPIPWLELYNAMQTKVVDGANLFADPLITGKIYEVQKYMSIDSHIYSTTWILFNEKFFQSLSKENQKIILRAGWISMWAGRMAGRLNDARGGDFLTGKGMKINYISPAEKARFIKASQQPMIEWLSAKYGREKMDKVLRASKEAEEVFK